MFEILLITSAGAVILIFFGVVILFQKLGEVAKKPAQLFKVGEQASINRLLGALSTVNFPFILELAVHHLGKEKNCYLAVSDRHKNQLLNLLKKKLPEIILKEAEDYYVFHHDGKTVAFWADSVNDEKLFDFDWQKIDFSEVNEVGEGAVAQVLFNFEKDKKPAELRLMASAPSSYQANEILNLISRSFSQVKFKTPKNINSFIHKFTFRESL